MQNYFFNSERELQDLGGGITRRILAYNGGLMTVEVGFQDGAIGTLHSHPHEQITYVVEGEFEFTVGDVKKIVKAGDTLYKEPNILHGCICLKAGKLLDIFTPIREDFINQK